MSTRRTLRKAATTFFAEGQALDARYFRAHPESRGYRRDATPGERRAGDLPPGTRVSVGLIPPNTRTRAFYTPDERKS